ncbi:MAG TPA: phage tail terminator-like protein [Longimicrobiales bacterium]
MASELRAKAAAIRAHFATEWKAARGYTDEQLGERVAWEGVDFTPPASEWVRLSILWGDAFEQTMGGPAVGKNEVVGVVSVTLFYPPGRGTGVLEGLADDVRDIFNRAEVSGVRFGAPSGPKPARERDGWVQTTVDVPFTVEETI